jgi:hypothetical protein
MKARIWTDSKKTIFGMKRLTKIGFWNAIGVRVVNFTTSIAGQ